MILVDIFEPLCFRRSYLLVFDLFAVSFGGRRYWGRIVVRCEPLRPASSRLCRRQAFRPISKRMTSSTHRPAPRKRRGTSYSYGRRGVLVVFNQARGWFLVTLSVMHAKSGVLLEYVFVESTNSVQKYMSIFPYLMTRCAKHILNWVKKAGRGTVQFITSAWKYI